MKKSRFFSVLLIGVMLLTACGNSDIEQADEIENSSSGNSTTKIVDTSEIFSDRDYEVEYDEESSAFIQLNGDSAICSSDAVEISGGTITIKDEGTYILSGILDDGMIIVETDDTDKTQLVLDNVSIHSETCAAIYIKQSDKVFITTAKGSSNSLSNGGTFSQIDDNNIDAVIFSKEDLTLNGQGTLVITSPAGHGVVSKDSLKITSGAYDINCASHGLDGKDEVCIADGTFTIVSGKDGIRGENEDDTSKGYVYVENGDFQITAQGDGISASNAIQIEDGSFSITTGDGSENASSITSDSWGNFRGGGRHQGGGMDMGNRSNMSTSSSENQENDSTSIKGIKADMDIVLNGGFFTINSADDAIHSNSSLFINGGTFEIASGDDAVHAEDTLTIAGGTISISKSYEGLEGLHILISGGDIELIASDDGLNAAGGTDNSGMTGGRDGMFGGMQGGSSNGSIVISGGTLNIIASGDGIDANGTLEITGGYTIVEGPTQGDTATLDYDSTAIISGGTFVGTGAAGMAQTFSDSEQGVVAVSVGNQPAGTEIKLTDSKGNTVMTYAPNLSFAVVILSSPEIESGENYTISVGNSSGEFAAD